MEKGPHFDELAAISDRRAASTHSSSEGVRLLDRLSRLFGAPPEENRPSDGETIFMWGTLEVRRLLGRGSFGEVYAAWDPTLRREVALKLRAPEVGTLRWLDEARNLARVRHSHVLTVHGADVLEGRAGIWTERVDGQTLEEILSSNGALTETEVVRIGRDLASALGAVHDAGLVHGDVKTSNIMLEAGVAPRRAVLVDFGTADKMIDDGGIPAYMIGTPLAMAPEVLEGHAASASSDVYGLGTTLFRLLTGRHPIEAQSIDELQRAHASTERARVRAISPNVSSRLARVIERALEPDPAQRWSNAKAFQHALDDIADPTRRIRARAAAVGAGVAALAAIGTIAFLAARPGGPISRGKLSAPLMPALYREALRSAGATQSGFGWTTGTPDLNGDGRSEVIAADSNWKNEQGKLRGRIILFNGSATGPDSTRHVMWTGDYDDEYAGAQISSAGDVNGDGFEEVLIGMFPLQNRDRPARARLFLGTETGPANAPSWSVDSATRDTGLGRTMTCAGDVNGDGFDDVLLGEQTAGDSLPTEGAIHLYPGSASGLPPVPSWTVRGGQAGALFGYFLRPAGDINGDGYDDVLAGAVMWDGASADCGQARLYLGGAKEMSTKPVWTFDGAGANSHLGNTVAGADVNGDGYSDVLIGEPQYSEVSRPERGRALVFLGGPRGPSRDPDWQALGPVSYSHFGFYVVGLGDVDGDGFHDIAISAPQYTDGKRVHLGMVEVYRGGTHGCETRAAWRIVGDHDDAHFGYTVAGGDLNGDRVPDLVLCAPHWSDKGSERGLILAFLGQRPK